MDYFEDFKNHLKIKGNKPQSVKNYDTYVAPWLEFCGQLEPQTMIHAYLLRFRSEATKKTAWIHIRHYVHWCSDNDLAADWTKKIKPRFGETAPPPTLTPEEFEKILKAIPSTAQGRRDRALLALIYYTGARRTAVCQLARADVNIPDRLARVVTKNAKELYLPLPRTAADELNSWLAWSAKLKSPWAFPSLRTLKKPIDPMYVTHALPRYAKAAGITKRVFVHLLRHTFATELHRADVPMETIQNLLGHSKLSVTEPYVRRLSSAIKMREAIDRVFKAA